MKDLSLYDQAGVVLPGAVVLLGALFAFPTLQPFFGKDGLGVGGLGLFILVAYILGQAVAALSNVYETCVWAALGGWPSDRLRKAQSSTLPERERRILETRLTEAFGADTPDLTQQTQREWRYYFRRIAHVAKSERQQVFNALYGLSRGLSVSALFALVLSILAQSSNRLVVAAVCGALWAIFLARMVRFARHYTDEVIFSFLNMPAS